MIYTNDPLSDFYRHDAEQDKQLKRLPRCAKCGEYIQQDTAVYIDGDWLCDDCVDRFRREVMAG